MARLTPSLLLLLCVACATANDAERAIDARDRDANGIKIGAPSIYDDSILQQQLAAAQARLARLQIIDQASIVSHLGSITGARQDISSVAVTASGPPTSGVVTTANGATQQTVSAPTGVTVTSAIPVQNTVTTVPQITPSIPSAPAATTTLPSAFSVSASDLLNEQVQLTAEVANLTLLLNGSLSDRIVTNAARESFIRPRLTIGFPIDITPDRRFRDAVAIIEVEVATNPDNDLSGKHERPTITALLPREKTYNVAAITDTNVSIGAGVVTQIAAIGASFMHGRKTYYIVKDQDILATEFDPRQEAEAPSRIGFGWQFRPVLGHSTVQSGLRQTFVQLTFPGAVGDSNYGTLKLRTYWRKYDKDRDVLGGIVPGSLNDHYPLIVVPGFEIKMKQDVTNLAAGDLEDLGNGQMLVSLSGRYAAGSIIRVGNTFLQPGAGMTIDYNLIRFVAPIVDLATKRAALVSRDGTETRIVVKNDAVTAALRGEGLKIETPIVTTIDETNSRLQIDTNQDPFRIISKDADHELRVKFPPLIVILGGKVFGYNDAPIQRDGKRLSLVVPSALLAGSSEVTVKPVLSDDAYMATKQLFAETSESERLVFTGQRSDGTLKYLLYGRRLQSMDVVLPPEASIADIGSGVDADNLRSVQLKSADVVKNNKHLVVQRRGERAFLIPIPPLVEATKQPLKFRERVAVGADDAVIVGDGVDNLDKLVIGAHVFTPLDIAPDGSFARVTGLVSAGITGTAHTVDCIAVPKSGKKVPLQLEVINTKVETIPH